MNFANLLKRISLLILILLLAACHSAKTRPPQIDPDLDAKGDKREETPAEALEMWHLQDPTTGYQGISHNKIVANANPAREQEVIVAVLDSGVDIAHIALKNKIWVNSDEIAANGIDDDNNGYVDDTHGWSFLGNKNGENILYDTLEVTREALRYEQKLAAGDTLTEAEIIYFEGVKKDFEKSLTKAEADLKAVEIDFAATINSEALLKNNLGQTDFTKEGLEKITSADPAIINAKNALLQIVATYRSIARYYRIVNSAKVAVNYFYNKAFDPRKTITQNDDSDFSEFNYGNNDVTGPESSHGTHVAGIVAAEASTAYKTRGVSQKVKIMVLRIVPNGDERDKDIVAAVRYAVNNGAQIINMSFGKDYSPYKAEVDKAFLYAEEKGVLIVHAAGNSAQNLDTAKNFPNRQLVNGLILGRNSEVQGWLEVGASAPEIGLPLLAPFSNYGSKTVDLFAPGFQILSTTPNQTWASFSGTSMASPVVAGSAALLMNRYAGISAEQTKEILLDQVRTDYERVRVPGAGKFDLPMFLKDISISGGLLDLSRSVVLADQLSK